MKVELKKLMNGITKNFPNPDYETKKLVMALVAISSGISKRSDEEKNEILAEAREKLLNLQGELNDGVMPCEKIEIRAKRKD